MIIDSHCHLGFPQLGSHNKDTLEYLRIAKSSNIGAILDIATNLKDFQKTIDFANSVKGVEYPEIYTAIGVHPLYIETNKNFKKEDFTPFLQNNNVIAIGETGFDGYYSTDFMEEQRELFEIHVEVAITNNLPIIIHTRGATKQTLEALTHNVKNNGLKGVIHCFTGDITFAKALLDLNFMLSFSGVLTYKTAKDIQEVAKMIPLNKVLVETDAPYLTPVPLRSKESKINKPEYVKYTFDFFTSLRKETTKDIELTLENNFYNLFKKAKKNLK